MDAAMSSGVVRVLDPGDLPAARALLDRKPLENLFIQARLDAAGLDRARLGCAVLGWFESDELTALCYTGANLVSVDADARALDAFCEQLGPRRGSASIMGAVDQTRGLYERLATRWGDSWSHPREIRAHQPLMAADSLPLIVPDRRVHAMEPSLLAPYVKAAVAMYTEEVGVSPLDGTRGYENYVHNLVMMGRAFGAYDPDRKQVWFKSDIGCAHEWACQIQGVWLDPQLRGRGMAEPAMAQVLALCLRAYPTVSLYVNDFNTRARRLYEGLGFRTVSELATVLY